MSEIVKELREHADAVRDPWLPDLLRRAADEIERLGALFLNTADGAPIINDATYYVNTGWGVHEGRTFRRIDYDGNTPVVEMWFGKGRDATATSFPVTRIFSTQEAAERYSPAPAPEGE